MADDPKLVVALEARLNKFEKQMKDAGVIADREMKKIEDRVSQNNSVFAATFLGNFLGKLAAGAAKQFISFIEGIPERMKAIQTAADLANLSLERTFQIAQGSGKEASALQSIENMARLLDRARRGEDNSLAQLFSANNAQISSIQTVEQLWAKVAEWTRNAKTNVQAQEIVQAAGASKDLTEHFAKGADEVKRLQGESQASAQALGRLAALSKDFEEQWKKGLDAVKAYLLENVGEWTRVLADFVRKIANFVEIVQAPGQIFREVFLGEKTTPGKVSSGLREAADAMEAWAEARKKAGAAAAGGGIETAARGPKGDRSANAPAIGGGGGSGSKDAVEREEDRINKRIKLLEAETATLGLNTQQREKARAEAELWAAVEKAGIPVTDELRAKIEQLSTKWGEAAQKAETARNAFASIESAAKDFGSAVADAFKGMVLEGKKFSEVLDAMVKRLAGRAIDRLFDLLLFGPTGKLTAGSGIFGSIFGGARAGGGPVSAGNSYLVGEHGPEIFQPGRSGVIQPNSITRSIGGSSFTYAPVIDARGADAAAVARLERVVRAQAQQLRANARTMASARHFSNTGVALS